MSDWELTGLIDISIGTHLLHSCLPSQLTPSKIVCTDRNVPLLAVLKLIYLPGAKQLSILGNKSILQFLFFLLISSFYAFSHRLPSNLSYSSELLLLLGLPPPFSYTFYVFSFSSQCSAQYYLNPPSSRILSPSSTFYMLFTFVHHNFHLILSILWLLCITALGQLKSFFVRWYFLNWNAILQTLYSHTFILHGISSFV